MCTCNRFQQWQILVFTFQIWKEKTADCEHSQSVMMYICLKISSCVCILLPCRKSAFGRAEHRTPVKRLSSDLAKMKGKMSHLSVEVSEPEPGGSVPETGGRRELRHKETPEKSQSPADPLLRPVWSGTAASSLKDNDPNPDEADDLPYLSTTDMYLCRWHRPPPSPLREPSPKKEECVASKNLFYTCCKLLKCTPCLGLRHCVVSISHADKYFVSIQPNNTLHSYKHSGKYKMNMCNEKLDCVPQSPAFNVVICS